MSEPPKDAQRFIGSICFEIPIAVAGVARRLPRFGFAEPYHPLTHTPSCAIIFPTAMTETSKRVARVAESLALSFILVVHILWCPIKQWRRVEAGYRACAENPSRAAI
jgi:hypothetical protein